MSEFAFELALCAALEQRRDGIIARQLGATVAAPAGRVLDVVCVEPEREFTDRTALSSETIPHEAIESTVGPGRSRPATDCFDCHPQQARRAIERAIDVGFFERDYRGGREYLRQVAHYPDWFGSIVGIENKPDLGSPGDLATQLRTDVSLGLVDQVILATESYVTRAHLHRLPDAVGVWRVHFDGPGTDVKADVEVETDGDVKADDDVDGDGGKGEKAVVNGPTPSIEVIREPSPLPVDRHGIELLEKHPGRTDVAVISPSEKQIARRRLAERAYGKGWRTFEYPGCTQCDPRNVSGTSLPYCRWNERVIDARSDCGPDCRGYEPGDEPPVDHDAERDRRTKWVADPTGRRRTQSGLDRF